MFLIAVAILAASVSAKPNQSFLYSFLVGTNIPSACVDKASNKNEGPLVEMKVGSVLGKYLNILDNEVAVFLGIPFATAPTRFAKPQHAKPWDGVLHAIEKPPQCWQYLDRIFDFIPVKGTNSEDCLYLNVWSPSRRRRGISRKLPVLVWIHGGGFITGSSAMDVYDGGVLASYGDVVVVTFNYRLGAFGFLSSGTEDAPGNAGFYDQIMALEWVRDNVEDFGGDPSSVTLFGESTGASSVSAHQVSPLSRGLFHRIFMMSATAYDLSLIDSPATAQSKFENFGEAVGCSGRNVTPRDDVTQVIQCLRDKDAETLARVQGEIISQNPLLFVLIAGGEAFPKHPIEYYDSGDFARVEAVLGDVKDEGTIFLNYMMPEVFPDNALPSVAPNQVETIISQIVSKMEGLSVEAVKEFYFRNVSDTDNLEIVRAIGNIIGDIKITCPTLYVAEKLKRAYLYWDTHRSKKDKRDEWMGSYHFSDVAYVFGHPIVDHRSYTPEDCKVSEDRIQKLVSFARTGNPLSPESEEVWPEFDSKNPRVHVLGSKWQNIEHPRAEACEFWRPYITKVV